MPAKASFGERFYGGYARKRRRDRAVGLATSFMTSDLRVALDTNVLAYAEGLGDERRCETARVVVADIQECDVILPAQTLGELFRVLTKKARWPADQTREAVMSWANAFAVADSRWAAFHSALDCCHAHGLQFWDALILSVAGENGCRYLLSEDMQAEFVWRGVTVVDPFAGPLPETTQSRK
jgi:predicted nucleic acid-binding protein